MSATTRRLALLALATVATVATGCSPLLYVLLQLRGHGTQGTLVVAQPVTGSTRTAGDTWAPSCVHPDGSDAAWTFVVPAAGTYRFDVHADYDSVLAVFQANGPELACNDDFGSTRESRLDVALAQGETVTVVVDGYHGATGDYTLRVDPGETATTTPPPPPPALVAIPTDDPGMPARCESAPLLTAGLVTGTVDHAVHTAVLSCGNHGPGGDVVYRFEATTAGTLAVSENSMFDALVELRDGCGAAHRVLGCNDDSPDTRHASLNAALTPGTYYLVVDAYSPAGEGPFALIVTWTPATPAPQPHPTQSPLEPVESQRATPQPVVQAAGSLR